MLTLQSAATLLVASVNLVKKCNIVRSDLIQTFKIINGIDKVEKTLFFEIEVGLEEDIQINYSKNVADLILGNMLLVIALLTNGNL